MNVGGKKKENCILQTLIVHKQGNLKIKSLKAIELYKYNR